MRTSSLSHRKKTRLKDGKKRNQSSQLWLARQLNDPLVKAAQQNEYRSRAAFKLLEIDRKYRLLNPNQLIVDLGAAPGGWSVISAKKTNKDKQKPNIIALDILPFEPIEGVKQIIADFNQPETGDKILHALNGHKANLVMSDMAADFTGNKQIDRLKAEQLAELVLEFACSILAADGALIVKLFQGGGNHNLMQMVRKKFDMAKNIKPSASRKNSAEVYLVAKNFRNNQ